jgi:hypothetical protein
MTSTPCKQAPPPGPIRSREVDWQQLSEFERSIVAQWLAEREASIPTLPERVAAFIRRHHP